MRTLGFMATALTTACLALALSAGTPANGVEGFVYNVQGEGLEGIRVQVWRGETAIASTTTMERGRYNIPQWSGDMPVRISYGGRAPWATGWEESLSGKGNHRINKVLLKVGTADRVANALILQQYQQNFAVLRAYGIPEAAIAEQYGDEVARLEVPRAQSLKLNEVRKLYRLEPLQVTPQ